MKPHQKSLEASRSISLGNAKLSLCKRYSSAWKERDGLPSCPLWALSNAHISALTSGLWKLPAWGYSEREGSWVGLLSDSMLTWHTQDPGSILSTTVMRGYSEMAPCCSIRHCATWTLEHSTDECAEGWWQLSGAFGRSLWEHVKSLRIMEPSCVVFEDGYMYL